MHEEGIDPQNRSDTSDITRREVLVTVGVLGGAVAVPTSSDTQVVVPSPNPFASLSFSPDGNYLYFRQAGDKTGQYHVLFRAPVLGGTPKLLIRDVDAHPVFSPDVQRIVFIRCNNPEADKCRWLSANPDGTNEQVLLIRPGNAAPRQLSWSPDGKRIAFSTGLAGTQDDEAVRAFDVVTRKEVPLYSHPEKLVNGVEWTSGGRGLVILYEDKESSYTRGQIGFVSYPAGKFEPLTNDTNNYTTVSLSGDDRTLATIQSQINGEIDTFLTSGSSFTAVSGLAKLIPQTRDVLWLSDTELLLILPTKILRVVVDGSQQTEIFSDNDVSLGAGAVCQHGETIVVGVLSHQNRSRIQLWRMNLDGSSLKRITDGETDGFPVCSPDGKFFYYFDFKNNQHMKLSFDGVSPEVLLGVGVPGSNNSQIQTVSRDGRMLAAAGSAVDPSTSTYKTRLAIFDSNSTKSPTLLLDADPRFFASLAQFTPDGKALTYVIRAENNVDNIWLQPLDGKPGRQITNFKVDQIYKFSWSPNGTKLLVGRGHVDSDVILLRDTSK
jgi:eukaryotic-like serine/threonine-protein kinase